MAKEVQKNAKEVTKKENNKKVVNITKKATNKKPIQKIAAPNSKNKAKQGAESKNTEKRIISKEKKQTTTKKASVGRGDEMTKLVEVILILLAIFAAFYLITYWVTKSKESATSQKDNDVSENTVIQYDEILLGNALDQNKDEYYVLVMSKDEITKKTFATEIETYKAKEGSIRLYTVNLNDIINKPYKNDTSKLDGTSISDLKVKTTTLIKVKDHKITESTEESSSVKNKLVELAK